VTACARNDNFGFRLTRGGRSREIVIRRRVASFSQMKRDKWKKHGNGHAIGCVPFAENGRRLRQTRSHDHAGGNDSAEIGWALKRANRGGAKNTVHFLNRGRCRLFSRRANFTHAGAGSARANRGERDCICGRPIRHPYVESASRAAESDAGTSVGSRFATISWWMKSVHSD